MFSSTRSVPSKDFGSSTGVIILSTDPLIPQSFRITSYGSMHDILKKEYAMNVFLWSLIGIFGVGLFAFIVVIPIGAWLDRRNSIDPPPSSERTFRRLRPKQKSPRNK